MRIVEAFSQALRSLASNTLRTLLTALGIIIGVGSVIGLLSIAAGFNQSVVSQIRSAGSSQVIILPSFNPSAGGMFVGLSVEDAEAIREADIPGIEGVSPVREGGGRDVRFRDNSVNASVRGVDTDYFSTNSLTVEEGRAFSQADYDNAAAVAVVGYALVGSLAGADYEFGANADEGADGESSVGPLGELEADEIRHARALAQIVGEQIRIANQLVTVIGVVEEIGSAGFGGGSADEIVYLPLTTLHSRVASAYTVFGEVQVQNIGLALADESDDTYEAVTAEIGTILRGRHRTDEDDFEFFSQNQLIEIFNTITLVASVFLGSVGGISLLVGGIGVMNIMLVTVTERTREIGIRKALGARYRDLMIQFLIEAVILSIIGGAIGIGLGSLIAFAVAQVPIGDGDPIPATVTLESVALAFGVSSAIGVIFGLYPANRAARMRPIEALRYE